MGNNREESYIPFNNPSVPTKIKKSYIYSQN